jgi:hypothetical protein
MVRGAGRARTVTSVAALVAVLVAGAAACGGSGSGDEIATPPSTGFTPRTEAPTSTTTEPTTASSEPPTSEPAGAFGPPTLSDTSTISTVGLDEVHFGMTLDAAQEAAGSELVTAGTREPSCFLASPAEGPDGVTFLFSDGTVERVDVSAGPIATRSGAKVGSTEAQVRELYGDQIEVQPRADGQPGNLLVFVPRDEADRNFRLVFTTDGTTVTSYRAGRVPQVLAPTGCG